MADDSDYYDPSSEQDTPADEPKNPDEAPAVETALLPKSLFGDKPLEPGAECKVKIEHVYDYEVEVSYVPHEEEPKGSEMDSAMAGMDKMVQPEE